MTVEINESEFARTYVEQGGEGKDGVRLSTAQWVFAYHLRKEEQFRMGTAGHHPSSVTCQARP